MYEGGRASKFKLPSVRRPPAWSEQGSVRKEVMGGERYRGSLSYFQSGNTNTSKNTNTNTAWSEQSSASKEVVVSEKA